MKHFRPLPPVIQPDPVPRTKANGHKVAILRRAMTDHGIEILASDRKTNELRPLWGGRLDGESHMFRSIMSAGIGHTVFNSVGNKVRTKQILADAGVRTPIGLIIDKEDIEGSFQAASNIGLPGVVKPKAGSHGHGVTLNIRTQQDFNNAVSPIKGDAIFEQEINGNDFRVLTIGTDVVACILRRPAHVYGDGIRTVSELVRAKNKIRAKNPSLCRSLIPLKDTTIEILKAQGYGLNSVPRHGAHVQLARIANIAAGGDSVDVTEFVHSGFVEICSEIPSLFGSPEIMGIDVLAEDISKAPDSQDWAVLELNANPDIDIHRWPYEGMPRDVGAALIKHYFPDAKLSPIIAADLSLSRSPKDPSFTRLLQRRATEYGVEGEGYSSGKHYALHVEGTQAAINRFQDWMMFYPGVTFYGSETVPLTTKAYNQSLIIHPNPR